MDNKSQLSLLQHGVSAHLRLRVAASKRLQRPGSMRSQRVVGTRLQQTDQGCSTTLLHHLLHMHYSNYKQSHSIPTRSCTATVW